MRAPLRGARTSARLAPLADILLASLAQFTRKQASSAHRSLCSLIQRFREKLLAQNHTRRQAPSAHREQLVMVTAWQLVTVRPPVTVRQLVSQTTGCNLTNGHNLLTGHSLTPGHNLAPGHKLSTGHKLTTGHKLATGHNLRTGHNFDTTGFYNSTSYQLNWNLRNMLDILCYGQWTDRDVKNYKKKNYDSVAAAFLF